MLCSARKRHLFVILNRSAERKSENMLSRFCTGARSLSLEKRVGDAWYVLAAGTCCLGYDTYQTGHQE